MYVQLASHAKFCIECGNELPARVKFCIECGTAVRAQVLSPVSVDGVGAGDSGFTNRVARSQSRGSIGNNLMVRCWYWLLQH
jgi:hypothetical protein